MVIKCGGSIGRGAGGFPDSTPYLFQCLCVCVFVDFWVFECAWALGFYVII